MRPSLFFDRVKSSWIIDFFAIWGLSAILILPLFTVVYFDNWGTIESIFMAHTRFLLENGPFPLWQPLWYGGSRFDYIYPPALPYGSALLTLVLGVSIPQAYHLYTAFFYCLGIAGVYIFVRALSGARIMAWLAAAATALVSPSFSFVEPAWIDAGARYFLPQRLNVLIAWGEGPHISALGVAPLAIAFCYWALRDGRRWQIAVAAILCSLTVANNFYGSVTLVILYVILVWRLWMTSSLKNLLVRAAMIPLLAYGLCACWLTPSYLRVTVQNLRSVQAGGDAANLAVAVVIVAVFSVVSYFYGRGRPELFYALFVCDVALVFGIVVLSDFWLGYPVFGAAIRFVPELDLALTLPLLAALRGISKARIADLIPATAKAPVAVVLGAVVLLSLSHPYVRNAWRLYAQDPNPENRIEYRLASLMEENWPDSRWYVDGSTRFWLDAWRNVAQIGGGSDQGLLNLEVVESFWELRMGPDPEISILWMQAYGVDGVVMHEERSQEVYNDFVFPKKFDGVLPVLYDSGEGDVIYQVPRRYGGLSRVVDRSAMMALPKIGKGDHAGLSAYVRAVEEGPQTQAAFQWESPSVASISAEIQPGQAVLAQVSYDPSWRAYLGDAALPIDPDVLGQMLIDVPPGVHKIRLEFETPLENQIGRFFSVTAGLAIVFLIGSDIRRRLGPVGAGRTLESS